MNKKLKGAYVERAAVLNIVDKKINAMHLANKKICKNKQDRELMEKGFEIGKENMPIPTEYQDNPLFKNGYDRGIRNFNVKQYEKSKQIIEEMVKNNIPLSNAPQYIQENQLLVSHYKLCQIKKIANIEKKQVQKNKVK